MRKSRWRGELDAATTEKEVLNTARDYVAFLARGELAYLPKDFKLGPLDTCLDITDLALRLVQAGMHFESQSEGLRLLNGMSEFFAAASERFTELGITSNQDSQSG
jgi:hypothetical protein